MHVNAEMKAFVLNEARSDFALVETRLSRPEPAAGELRLRVVAAALNPVDAKLCTQGIAAWTWPHVPGVDAAGVVDAVGEGVDPAWLGARVMVHAPLARQGSFAESLVLAAHAVSRVPESIALRDAASLPCAALTAWQAIARRLALAEGQTILIEAAAGGVGGFAVQFARLKGARVIATASAANRDYVLGLGAHEVIDYRREDVRARVLEFTEGRGLDAVLDTLGGEAATRDLGLLGHQGAMACLLGLPSAAGVDVFALAPSLHVVALGGAWSSGCVAAQRDLARLGDEVLGMVERGEIRLLPIEVVAPRAEALSAALHRQLEGRVRGKLVLELAAE